MVPMILTCTRHPAPANLLAQGPSVLEASFGGRKLSSAEVKDSRSMKGSDIGIPYEMSSSRRPREESAATAAQITHGWLWEGGLHVVSCLHGRRGGGTRSAARALPTCCVTPVDENLERSRTQSPEGAVFRCSSPVQQGLGCRRHVQVYGSLRARASLTELSHNILFRSLNVRQVRNIQLEDLQPANAHPQIQELGHLICPTVPYASYLRYLQKVNPKPLNPSTYTKP